MKSRTLAITLFAALAIPVRLASAQVTCTVTDLGMLGGTFAQPDTLNNRGEAVGEPLCPVTQPFIDPDGMRSNALPANDGAQVT